MLTNIVRHSTYKEPFTAVESYGDFLKIVIVVTTDSYICLILLTFLFVRTFDLPFFLKKKETHFYLVLFSWPTCCIENISKGLLLC